MVIETFFCPCCQSWCAKTEQVGDVCIDCDTLECDMEEAASAEVTAPMVPVEPLVGNPYPNVNAQSANEEN